MPCEKCEAKFTKLVTPDVKEGSKRIVGVNKLIEKATKKDKIVIVGSKCKICKTALHMKGKYCAPCAHKNGRCWMCGKRIVDVTKHNMSLV
ncbi:postsynaptic protein CRIPT, putative [Eimeria maxima]|uniref:Cysteine-rich PDZ-binding protein n=1 Tax=Eimeria maxima TaxID=5804 RepID=U6M162_EIMMA|nr:postsynaptic protein CRIPT, putative [Eimeria maxima]CDJ56169.1 postsynaptic protein CRIPT, putative [Eimeria maxima]